MQGFLLKHLTGDSHLNRFFSIYLISTSFISLIFLNINTRQIEHPSNEEKSEISPPVEPLAINTKVPVPLATLTRDMFDGFNLSLKIHNFKITIPHSKTPDFIVETPLNTLQGHIHLYINGEKKMRVYGERIHIPSNWTKPGMNKLTLSIHNYMHEAFTYENREIKTTILFESKNNTTNFIKSQYYWPQKTNK